MEPQEIFNGFIGTYISIIEICNSSDEDIEP